MKSERLKALRELCDRATPGPWVIGAIESGAAAVDAHDGNVEITGFIESSDALLIAAARTAIPELLDYVARLEAKVSDLEERLFNAYGDDRHGD